MVTVSPDSSADQLCDVGLITQPFQALFPWWKRNFFQYDFFTHF